MDVPSPGPEKVAWEGPQNLSSCNPSHNNPTTEFDHDKVASATLALLTAKSPSERAAAAEELGALKSHSAVTYLVAALYDSSAEVWRSAALALGCIGDSSALGPLYDLKERENGAGDPAIERAINAIQAQSEESSQRESQLREEAENLRAAEIEARRRAAAEMRRRTETELSEQAREQVEHLLELENIRRKAEECAFQRFEVERHLNREIANLKETEVQQLQLLSEAEARKLAHEGQIHETALEIQRCATEEQHRIAYFETVMAKANEEAEKRSESLKQLNAKIDELTQLEVEQLKSIAETDSQISIVEENRQRMELKFQQSLGREQQLRAEFESLKQSELEIAERISAATEQIRQVEAAARQAEQQEQARLAELRQVQLIAQEKAREQAEVHSNLVEKIEALQKLIDEQLARIADAEEHIRVSEAEALRQADEEKRLKTETVALHEANALARRLAAEELRQQVEAELQKQAEEEELLTTEFNLLREAALQASQNRATDQKILSEEIERLRAAELHEQHELEELEARRVVQELEFQKVETERLRRGFEEQERITALEEKRAARQLELHSHIDAEKQLSSDIEELRLAEASQLERISSLENQIQQIKQEALQAAAEEARLQNEMTALQKAEAEARRKASEELQQQVADDLREEQEQQKASLAQLEFLRQQAAENSARLSEQQEHLTTETQQVQTEVAQKTQELERHREQLNLEIERLRVEEIAHRQQLTETEARKATQEETTKQLRAELDRQAQEEFERIAVLEQLRIDGELEADQRSQTAQQLKELLQNLQLASINQAAKIDSLRSQIKQLESDGEIQANEAARLVQEAEGLRQKQAEAAEEASRELEAQILRRSEEETLHLNQLDTIRDAAEEEANNRLAMEQQLNSQIEALRLAETEQLAWLAEAEAIVRQQQQNEEKRLSDLEALHSQAEIAQLCENEKGQLIKIEEAKLRISAKPFQLTTDSFQVDLSSSQMVQAEKLGSLEIQSLPKIEQSPLDEFSATQAQIRKEIFEDQNNEQVDVVEIPELHDTILSNEWSQSDADEGSFLILDLDEVVDEQPKVEVAEVVYQPEPGSYVQKKPSNLVQSKTNAQSVDLVMQEKGIGVAEEEGPVPVVILDKLRSKDPADRTAGLFEVTQFVGDEAFSHICEAFDDQVIDVRNAAIHALFQTVRDRAASFTRALREASPERRRRMGAALAESGIANEAIDNLIGESREKTYDAFSLLFLMAKAGEIQPLVRSIETHQDLNVKLAVISLLGFSNHPDVVPAFRRLAVRASLPSEIRSALMEAIHQISTQTRQGVQSAA